MADNEDVRVLSDKVLDAITRKLDQAKGVASGTEAGTIISGISDLSKLTLSPFKMITQQMSSINKSIKEWQKEKEDKNKKDKNENSDDYSNSSNINFDDIAKETTSLDMSEQLKELVAFNTSGFEGLDNQLSNSGYFLEDIAKSVGMLIYGNQALLEQLQSNQQNTKVFQVSKKELTAFEKEQQKNETKSLNLLEHIQDKLVDLDNELSTNLIEALSPDENIVHESNDEKEKDPEINVEIPDATFQKEETPEEKETKGIFKKIGKGIISISKGVGILLRFAAAKALAATVAMSKTLLIIAGIAAVALAIDWFQAAVRAKMDEFPGTLGEKFREALSTVMGDIIENLITTPLMEGWMFLRYLWVGVKAIEYELKMGFANMIESVAGLASVFSDDVGKSISEAAMSIKKEAREDYKETLDSYNKAVVEHNEKYGDKLLGSKWNTLPGLEEQTEKSTSKLKEQAEKDKQEDPSSVKELSNGEIVQLNSQVVDLTREIRKLELSDNDKDKQSAKELQQIADNVQKRNIYIEKQLEQERLKKVKDANGLSSDDDNYSIDMDDPEQLKEYINALSKEEQKSIENKIKEEWKKQNPVNLVQPGKTEETNKNISAEERQIAEKNSQIAKLNETLKNQQPNQNNQVQVNNSSNTQVIQQPLTVRNNTIPKQSRTTIGTGD